MKNSDPSTTAADFDLLVAGGGPGGSAAACYARMLGYRVLVIEKEHFPRFKIGESLLPKGNDILKEIGVWPKVDCAGFVRKFGAQFYLHNGQVGRRLNFADSLVREIDEYSYQVDRSRFDSILLDHAAERGAEVRQGVRVAAIETDGERSRVRLEGGGDGPCTVTARWVIDASGREGGDLFPEKRPTDPCPLARRVAIYSHFHHVVLAPGRGAGDTVAVRTDDGWFWLIPLDAERTSVGLVATVEALRKSGQTPEAYFRQIVADAPKLRELCGRAEAVTPFRVTADYSYFRRDLATRRVILVGDSAGFFDPIFSSGVYMAMWCARNAVRLMARADRARRGLTLSERRRYTRAVKRHASVFQRLIQAFYDNDSFAVFMSGAPLGIRPAVCSIVAGHAQLIWPLAWRFRLFLIVCWLQKHRLPLVPRLDYSTAATPVAP